VRVIPPRHHHLPEGARYSPIITNADDRALVSAAQAGDRVALDTLLRRHYDRLFALCRRITGSDADGADAAQEALLAIVRGLPRFDGRAQFSTWAYRVTTNVCLDELRRRRRRPIVGLGGRDDGSDFADPTADAPPLDEQVGDRLALDAALAQLPADFRAAVVLRDVCQLDYAEIAEVLGIPPGTVRSRISRGRVALANLMTGNPDPTTGRPTD
jgi:RNA polymerase sigma-70 factor (ECF subfamily)